MYQAKCANVLCSRVLRGRTELIGKSHSRTGLCYPCAKCVQTSALPHGGFISSHAVRATAYKALTRLRPTASEKAAAVRYARGSRYPMGNWDDRPAYRVSPLKYGRANIRLPHLLVGRRTPPSAVTIASAFVQYILAGEVMETGSIYNKFLAGGTFMGRRGLCVPKGRKDEVLTGDARYSKWMLGYKDFSIVGTHALRSAKLLGMDKADRELKAFIVVTYRQGLEAGTYRPPISCPIGTMPGGFLGDHPHDHQFAPQAKVPRKYFKSIRRSSGMIKREWPEGLDTPIDERPAKVVPPSVLKLPTYTPTTDATDWLFNPA